MWFFEQSPKWLQIPPYNLNTCVVNRVSQFYKLFNLDCWNSAPYQNNPAYYASRGILASQILSYQLWKSRPEWLSMLSNYWSSRVLAWHNCNFFQQVEEIGIRVIVFASTSKLDALLAKYSFWNNPICVICYVLGFIHNCRRSTILRGPLLTYDCCNATKHMVLFSNIILRPRH